jgi:hypothetical protein
LRRALEARLTSIVKHPYVHQKLIDSQPFTTLSALYNIRK